MVIIGECCAHSSALIIDWILLIHTSNEDNHTILDEFKIRSDPRTDFEQNRLIIGKNDVSLFSVVLDPINLTLASNEDMHYCFDEFEFWPHPITGYGVGCH